MASTPATQPSSSAPLPDYSLCGRYDGSVPASRWLARLAYDMRRYNNSNTPADFFEAIEILFDGDAATWLDSTPRFRSMVDRRDFMTTADITTFKEALIAEFPTKVVDHTEGNIQSDIKSFSQEDNEPIQAYYKRAVYLLRRAHCRDEPPTGSTGTSPLSPLEQVMLSGIISAFVEGLKDPELRSAVLTKSVTSCGSLARTFQIVQDTQNNLANVKEIEARLREKQELDELKALFNGQWGDRPISSVLAELRSTSTPALTYTAPQGLQSQAMTAPAQQHLDRRGSNPNTRGTYNSFRSQHGRQAGTSLPPKNLSRNKFVNGSEKFTKNVGPPLCSNCGELGHIKRYCINPPLEAWEQTYLQELIFPPDSASTRTAPLPSGNAVPTKPAMPAIPVASSMASYEACAGSWRWQPDVQETQQDNKAPESQRIVEISSERIPDVTIEQFSGIKLDADKETNTTHSGCVTLGRESTTDTMKLEAFVGEASQIEAYIGEASRKRQRVDLDDILNDEDESGPTRTRRTAKKRGPRKAPQLKEIVGRKGRGPLDYTKLAEGINVTVSLLDLYQMSPDLTRAFRVLSTRVNKRTAKDTGTTANTALTSSMANSTVVEGLKSTFITQEQALSNPTLKSKILESVTPILTLEQKAFRVPVTVRAERDGKPVNVLLPARYSQADQGSDMVIASLGFLNALSIIPKTLKSRGYEGLTMNVADGSAARLTHYCTIDLCVLGIWRQVEAFVRPHNERNLKEIHLLLGLPWLHAMDAKIFIRDSKILLGDVNRGEEVKELQGPQFMESAFHKLILQPKAPDTQAIDPLKETLDEESSESGTDSESGESDTDSESDSDDDEITTIPVKAKRDENTAATPIKASIPIKTPVPAKEEKHVSFDVPEN